MKIHNKTILIGGSIVLVTLLLIGGISLFFNKSDKPAQQPVVQETEQETTQNKGTSNTANHKGQPEPLIAFANALCDEDYQAILDMLYLPNDALVTATNIQDFLEQSNIADFLGSDYVGIQNVKTNKTAIAGELISKDKKTICPVIFQANMDGNMVLGMSSAYEERTLVAPGNAQVRIGGVTLDTTKAKDYNPQHHPYQEGVVAYQVICPVTDFDAYVSTQWADYNITVPYEEDKNKPYLIFDKDINESVLQGACDSSKDLMNNIIKTLVDNGSIDEYLADNADKTFKEDLTEWCNKVIKTGQIQATPDLQLSSVTITDEPDKISYIPENQTIHVFTSYTSVWGDNKQHTGKAEFIIKQTNDGPKLVWTNMKDDKFINNNLSNQ